MNDSVLTKSQDRLALEGEELMVYRFRNGLTGLISCRDFWSQPPRRHGSYWRRHLHVFSLRCDPGPLIHVPAGSWLRLIGIPEVLRSRAGECPDAIFIQFATQSAGLCDALALAYGNALLQFVPDGQQLKILSLSSPHETEPELNELEPAPLVGSGLR